MNGNSPRLLLLSDEGPDLSSAGAILLYRLLEGYSPDRLRVIARRGDAGAARLGCKYAPLMTPWQRLEATRLARLKRSLRGFGLVPAMPADGVDRILGGFAPELVLCVMQHACCYDAAHSYARSRSLPLVVIVHDVNEQFEPVYRWARAAGRRRDAEFYRYATRRLCVSPEMEQLCADLYGARGEVMYPNRDEALRPRPLAEANALKSPGQLTVGFVGSLNYGYGDELLRMLPAFRAAHARIVAFSHPPGGQCAALLAAKDSFDFRGYAPPARAWAAIQSECDAVILPYPDSPGHLERLYRHHFPSKLPEYLALGMPVVVTGPDYATGVKWALRNPQAAISWIAGEPPAFAGILQRLRDDPVHRLKFATNAVAAGLRDFDPHAIRRQFIEHLREAAREQVGIAVGL